MKADTHRYYITKCWSVLGVSTAAKTQKSGQCQGDPAFQHGNRTTLEILWLHRMQCSYEDHHHTAAAAVCKAPPHWKQPPGRPDHTWLTAIASDLRPLNIGPSYAWKKAASRQHWRLIVDTAMLKKVFNEQKERERHRYYLLGLRRIEG